MHQAYRRNLYNSHNKVCDNFIIPASVQLLLCLNAMQPCIYPASLKGTPQGLPIFLQGLPL